MSLTVTVRNGGAAGSATVDITDRLRTDLGLQVGNRAHMGESGQSTLYIDDDSGEYGNEEDLPVGLTMLSIAAHNVVTVTETATDPDTALVRGRVIPKEIGRADIDLDRARQVVVRLDDYNADLKGLSLLTEQVRPEETDVARVTWVFDTFLSGSPRLTTDLTSGIVVGNTATMPAKTYEKGTTLGDILSDCAITAEKTFFVMADGTFYYAPYDDTTQLAGIRISDREDEADTEGVCESTSPVPESGYADATQGDPTYDFSAVDGSTNSALVVLVAHDLIESPNAVSAVWWHWDNGKTDGRQAFTRIAGPTDGMEVWLLVSPNAALNGDPGTAHVLVDQVGTVTHIVGVEYVTGVDASDPYRDTSFATGTGSTSSVAVTSSAGDLVLNIAGQLENNIDANLAAPTADAAQTVIGTDTENASFGQRDAHMGFGRQIAVGASTTTEWTFNGSRAWWAISIAFQNNATGEGLPTFPPIWTGPASTEDGQGLLSGGVLRHNGTGAVSETRSAVADDYDYWVETINDAGAVDATDAAARLSAILDVRQFENRTYQVAVQLHRTQVGCVMAGQLIWIKARAIPDADDQFRQRRIASLEWQWVGPEHYLAVMELDRPLNMKGAGASGSGSGQAALATRPRNAGEMPIEDADDHFTGDTVEEALAEIGEGTAGGTADSTEAPRTIHGRFVGVYHLDGVADIHVRHSEDGITWRDGAVVSTNMADPSIIHWDGRYWVCGTRYAVTSFGLYVSDDLETWAEIGAGIAVDAAGTNVWAPEWVRNMDGTPYLDPVTGFPALTVNVSTDSQTTFTVRELHPTNRGMTTWSAATTVTGTGLPTAIIDAFLMVDGDDRWLWYKDEVNKHIEIARSTTALTSGYTVFEDGDWAGWFAAKDGSADSIEGPCVIRLDDGRWRIYFNENVDLVSIRTVYSETTDDWRTGTSTWTAQTQITTPAAMSNGSLVFIPGVYDHMRDPDAHSELLAEATGYHYEALMAAGTSPPEPLETGDGLDWLYARVAD